MAEHSGIEWTDHTWNPWVGCTRVSAGCAGCYMFREVTRYGGDPEVVRRTSPATWDLLQRRHGGGELAGQYRVAPGDHVFVCSWSDFFHVRADPWRAAAWERIRRRPDVVFQIVTKRPERIRECLPSDWGNGWRNVWLGVSVESEKHIDRVLTLAAIPAAIRWVSAEPLLGPLDAAAELWLPAIDWLVAGGETGWPGVFTARPTAPAWARALRDSATAAGVAFFWKQWGDWVPEEQPTIARSVQLNGEWLTLVGKRNTLDVQGLLDGRTWRQFPTEGPGR